MNYLKGQKGQKKKKKKQKNAEIYIINIYIIMNHNKEMTSKLIWNMDNLEYSRA